MYLSIPLQTLLWVLISLSFSGCATDAPAETTASYQANFYVRYLAENQELRGQASFFQQDSTALELMGGVSFMGSGTQQRQLPGTLVRYEGKMRIPFQNSMRFAFKLPGEEEQTEIKLPMEGVNDFSVTTASISEGLRLKLNSSLADDESLLLLFTDPNQEARTIVRAGPFDQEELFIPADAISLFTPGEYQLYLVKSKQIQTQVKNLSYEASIEFYSKEETFVLAE